MGLRVQRGKDGHRLCGSGGDVDLVNRFLAHLAARGVSPATARAYAFDILNFLRFCVGRGLGLGSVEPGDLFDYLDWQTRAGESTTKVVRIDRRRRPAPAPLPTRRADRRHEHALILVELDTLDHSLLDAEQHSP